MHGESRQHGWFTDSLAAEFQQFYDDLIDGLRPKLVVQAPPQHGKSICVVDFIAWVSGRHPEWRTIFASFSNRLGIRANKALQRIYDSDKYKKLFSRMRINPSRDGEPLRNQEIIESMGYEGYFRNTTVAGSVTGESADLGIIDDPIKGRAEANSPVTRDKAWDWLNDDFMTRFSDDAGLLMILTRWHVDDPAGRLIDSGARSVNYKAIATVDETYRKSGEALFPEIKSLEFLQDTKGRMVARSWLSLYQGMPSVEGSMSFGNFEVGPKVFTAPDRYDPETMYRVISIDVSQCVGEDNHAMAEQGRDYDGDTHLLDLYTTNTASISDRLEKTAEWVIRRRPNRLVVERNTDSIAFIDLLKIYLKERDCSMTIEEPTASSRGAKEQYIVSWLEPVLHNDSYFCKLSTISGTINERMSNFSIDRTDNQDDELDVMASGVRYLKTPIRPKKELVRMTGDPSQDIARKKLLKALKGKAGKKIAYS
ncbi:terminase family protein [uncultured Paraglaciecola sp.]|uniref:terminase large subunit domain-containing protein n=1 Tax=uncultured Paraglaciecola sp. TaxID=1765024 RepID=UPI002605F3B5|nr:terminase family protein [uncultured Paraglaciecola sp.]